MFKLYCYNNFSVSYEGFKFKNTKSVAYFSVFCFFSPHTTASHMILPVL